MSKHVDLEKIILGELSDEDMEHISSCEKCSRLYNSIFKPVPDEVIRSVDSKTRGSLLLKFREMKTLGYFSGGTNKSVNFLKYVAISFSFLVFVILTFAFLYVTNSHIDSSKLSLEDKITLNLSNISKNDISIKIDNSTINIYVDGKVDNFTIHGLPKGDFKSIKLIIGDQVYEFFANEFNASYSNGKLTINNETLNPKKEERFINEVIMNDGSTIKCNVEEIGDSFVIIDTESGKRRLNKNEITKIRYLY